MMVQAEKKNKSEGQWTYSRYEYRIVRYGMRNEKFIVPWQMDHTRERER